MKPAQIDYDRIRSAWEGRISGCMLGKPVELLSIWQGRDALVEYLTAAGALPLRDYIPLAENSLIEITGRKCCRGQIERSEPDDDTNYTVLALMMLEEYGLELSTANVGRAWLRLLPGGATFTAERAAYATLLQKADYAFTFGGEPGFDLTECATNEWSEWIGAQIRADLYGWVCPGRPSLAADLARRDASLSHTGNGIYGAVFIAALGAAIPETDSLEAAIDIAAREIPDDSGAAEAIRFGLSLNGKPDAVELLHERYKDLNPVHTLNNLALVIWGLISGKDDFSRAIGDVVAAGWDTDCNGATVGGLWGLQGKPIPSHWTDPWQERVAVTIVGVEELLLGDLIDRTVKISERLCQTDK